MLRYKEIIILTGIMSIVSFAIAIISILMIYDNAKANLSDRLTDIVNREKSSISVWKSIYHASENDIIHYLTEVRKGNVSVGKQGEIVFARLDKDSIDFIIHSKTSFSGHKISKGIPTDTPMNLALQGKSGFIKSKDYQGIEVFASYAFVKELNWGIVAKIPTSEINHPYIVATILVFLMCLLLISLASYFFIRITNPLINSVYESEFKLSVVNENLIKTITQLNSSKEKIENNERQLIKLNADKDRFVKILAHDLINPFNGIIGFLDNLSEKARDYDIATIEKQLNLLRKTARSTYDLLQDLLVWVRAQSDNLPFENQKIDLNEACRTEVETLMNFTLNKKISINYSKTENTYLKGDVNMVKIILRNLLSNAIKFSRMNGMIHISVEKGEENAIIIISDNGIGMNLSEQAKLWDITQRFTSTGTAGESGTGLGLSICRELVEKHGGKIWVESQIGIGSDFKFTMPLYFE